MQVTEHLNGNKEREISGMLDALNNFDLEKGLMLTEDSHDTIRKDGKTIEVKPVWYWLLEQFN